MIVEVFFHAVAKMTNKNITKVARYPAVIADMVPNPAEQSVHEQFARKAFERETQGRGYNYDWSESGQCYSDYQTRWIFDIFLIGYRAGKEEV
jgi:hypothetical protein